MKPTYRIRPADETEFDALQDIERAASVLFPPGRLPDPEDVMPKGELRNALDAHLLYVASVNERAVGFYRRMGFRFARLGLPPDHPTLVGFPGTDYLSGIVIEAS